MTIKEYQSPIWVWNMKNVLLLAFMKRVLVSISYMGMELGNIRRNKKKTTRINLLYGYGTTIFS